jgi:TRAP-type C4-dicarboxylate transport system substrate-binding protein
MAGGAWKALPPDLQTILQRNANLYAAREERDVGLQEKATSDRLSRLGMRIEYPDLKPFRARLTSYYQRWKSEYGPAAWGALEQYSGKLA